MRSIFLNLVSTFATDDPNAKNISASIQIPLWHYAVYISKYLAALKSDCVSSKWHNSKYLIRRNDNVFPDVQYISRKANADWHFQRHIITDLFGTHN